MLKQTQEHQLKQDRHRSSKANIFTAALFVASAFFFLPFSASAQEASTTATSTATTTSQFQLPSGLFIAPTLMASSVAIYDPVLMQFIYEKDATSSRPIASIAKILTGMVVKDILNQYKSAPKTITLKTIIPETIADRSLKAGEVWNANDLLHYMLMTSSNTAAEAFGGQIIPYSSFISLMNHKAKTLGLTSVRITNTSGLPLNMNSAKKVAEIPSDYASAQDVAKLLAAAYKDYPELINYSSTYKETFKSRLAGKTITHIATSTDELLATPSDIIGGKTGFTNASGGNLAVLVNTPMQYPLSIVVLGSTYAGRFLDVAALASSTRNFFTIK